MGPVPRPASGVLHGHHSRITPPAREAKRQFSKHLSGFRCSFHRRGNRVLRSPARRKSRCSGHDIPVLRFRYGSYHGEVRICRIIKALKSSAGNSSELWHATAPSIPNFTPSAYFLWPPTAKKRAESILKQRCTRREFPSGTYLQGTKKALPAASTAAAPFLLFRKFGSSESLRICRTATRRSAKRFRHRQSLP